MTAIRVLHLIASSAGGGAIHVRELASGLDRARFSVEVAMPDDGGDVRREEFAALGIPFHGMDITRGFSPRALWKLRRLVAGIDTLHVHGARAALYGRLASLPLGRRRPRLVFTTHGLAAPHYPHPRRDVLLAIERSLAPFTDRFIAVSRADEGALLTAGITRPERIRLVLNGIDVPRFQNAAVDRRALRGALGIPLEAPLVTTVCRLHRARDFGTLLAAFREITGARSEARLLIVGDGPSRLQVEGRIRDLGLGAKVTLAGTRRDVAAILAASDVFVLTTTLWEGLPLAILEAMAAGLPVVATDLGGIGEAVAHRESGILVCRGDPLGLAEALLAILADRPSAREMGARGRDRAGRHFTVERMRRETVAVYEEVLLER